MCCTILMATAASMPMTAILLTPRFTPVVSQLANAWQLYDMGDNVYEWT